MKLKLGDKQIENQPMLNNFKLNLILTCGSCPTIKLLPFIRDEEGLHLTLNTVSSRSDLPSLMTLS